MSQHTYQESMSAIMDGEANDLELRRVLKASSNPKVREQWQRYQIARAAMHCELMDPSMDISARVMAAIDGEASHEKPRRNMFRMARVAVAASVTLAVLGGVTLYHQTGKRQLAVADKDQSVPMVQGVQSSVRAQVPAILAGYKGDTIEQVVPRVRRDSSDWRYNYAPRQPINDSMAE